MSRNFKVAVIGAGSAGTFAAYELHKQLGDHIDFTVYERKEHAGGRAWNVDFAGTHVEVGGVLLHSSGKYGYELMDYTGSKEGTPGVSVDGSEETYAFWTSEGFPVFTKTSLASMALGILRYVGPRSALVVTNAAKDMAKKMEGIYDFQERGQRFRTTEDILEACGLLAETRKDLATYLASKGVNNRMATDIVEPIVHNMYNQGLELNAFAGLVGLAGAGLAGAICSQWRAATGRCSRRLSRRWRSICGCRARLSVSISHAMPRECRRLPLRPTTARQTLTISLSSPLLRRSLILPLLRMARKCRLRATPISQCIPRLSWAI